MNINHIIFMSYAQIIGFLVALRLTHPYSIAVSKCHTLCVGCLAHPFRLLSKCPQNSLHFSIFTYLLRRTYCSSSSPRTGLRLSNSICQTLPYCCLQIPLQIFHHLDTSLFPFRALHRSCSNLNGDFLSRRSFSRSHQLSPTSINPHMSCFSSWRSRSLSHERDHLSYLRSNSPHCKSQCESCCRFLLSYRNSCHCLQIKLRGTDPLLFFLLPRFYPQLIALTQTKTFTFVLTLFLFFFILTSSIGGFLLYFQGLHHPTKHFSPSFRFLYSPFSFFGFFSVLFIRPFHNQRVFFLKLQPSIEDFPSLTITLSLILSYDQSSCENHGQQSSILVALLLMPN